MLPFKYIFPPAGVTSKYPQPLPPDVSILSFIVIVCSFAVFKNNVEAVYIPVPVPFAAPVLLLFSNNILPPSAEIKVPPLLSE